MAFMKKRQSKTVNRLKTSFGGKFVLPKEISAQGDCKTCREVFDFKKDILKLTGQSGFTPLTQKKICSSNRAGSYENGVKNLFELANIETNRNQVRNISKFVGKYIEEEFKELYNDILLDLPSSTILQKHPLIEQLKIDEKYLNSSNYIITIAVDGGRMQLFNWIPSDDENIKGKKEMNWHENKVFRISVYDKSSWSDTPENIKFTDGKAVYKSAQMISGLTTYAATNVIWKETVPLIKSHLYMRGIKLEDVQLCISDGSEHIMREIFKPLFPNATHILDYYHKAEALHECIKIIGKVDTQYEKKLKQYLWEGVIDKLVTELKISQSTIGTPIEGKRNPDAPKVKLDNFIKHLGKNKRRMNYSEFKKHGYPIGSGSIESAVKLFNKRVKGTEKQWNEEGGEAILHLYSFLLSEDNRWNELWAHHTPWK